jgi:alpha-glucosidase (family GH31 glycosyl hydrolase)
LRIPVAALAALATTACGGGGGGGVSPVARTLGAFVVRTDATGFAVETAGSAGVAPRVLLQSLRVPDAAAYAPLAVRHDEARWEMLFGAWRIRDGDASWTAATRFVPDGEDWRVFGARGAVATMHAESPVPEALRLVFRAVDPDVNRLSLAFECAPEDHFLGFGAQADAIDHRGHKVPVWTSEPGIGKSASDDPPPLWFVEGARHASSHGLPTWLSPRGYMGVVENDHRSVFDLCAARQDAWRVEVWDREIVLWLYHDATTGAPRDALRAATAGVLGRPPVPPPMAFAPWHDAIFGPDNVRRIARLVRDADIPSSVIWTEDFRGGQDVEGQGYRLREEWALDRALYPDAEALAAELRASGFAWLAYFNTFVVTGTDVYREADAGGHLVRGADGAPYLFDGVTFVPSGLADLSRPGTREWVKGYMRAALDAGFDGWMADYGEWLPHDAVLDSGEDPLAAHNRYPREWVQLNAEVLAERARDEVPRLFFARAGWLGSTAHTPVVWAGDQRTSFQRDDGLYTVVPMGLGLGLAGVSTYGHDIGGYQSASNPPSTKELFFRWTALGALSPVMRTHHGLSARENWWFGADEETLGHFRRWARLHIRLFPYLFAAAHVATGTGLPIMRALALSHPEDPRVWTLSDQYMLGDHLLVAPVLDEGATGRSLYLPAGTWLALDGGAPMMGPADVTVGAPLTEIPVFARAGAVIPLLDPRVQTLRPAQAPVVDLDDVADVREVWLFLGAGGEYVETDGTRYVLVHTGDGAPRSSLPVCTEALARGCVAERDGTARRMSVRLAEGETTLDLGTDTLSVTGPSRRIDVLVRW